jgi:hypothetical protein
MQQRLTPPRRNRTGLIAICLAAIAIGMFVVVSVWPLLSNHPLGTPGPNNSERTAVAGSGRSDQAAGASRVGQAEPNRPEDAGGQKARDIEHSASALSLTDEQRTKLRSIVAGTDAPKTAPGTFTVAIGAAVPGQANLRDLPHDASDILNGFAGDMFTIVRDQLVVVDSKSRRIVAIVPNVA